jgi:hypothetical protein
MKNIAQNLLVAFAFGIAAILLLYTSAYLKGIFSFRNESYYLFWKVISVIVGVAVFIYSMVFLTLSQKD